MLESHIGRVMSNRGSSKGFQLRTMGHVVVVPIFGGYSLGIPCSNVHRSNVSPFLCATKQPLLYILRDTSSWYTMVPPFPLLSIVWIFVRDLSSGALKPEVPGSKTEMMPAKNVQADAKRLVPIARGCFVPTMSSRV